MAVSTRNDRFGEASFREVTERTEGRLPRMRRVAADRLSETLTHIRAARRTIQRTLTVAEALLALLLFDLVSLAGFKRTHALTHHMRVRGSERPAPGVVGHVCWCVDEACVWYWKRSYCLQRSTIVTWMLRRRGVAAELVIGYRPLPVDSHAWVEVDGIVVNDRPQYQRFYRVLERL